ncbi:MAG: hypothetical protein BWY04_00259 [candidate division CPR1 bacterium ADurb.Bin160]|jgi:hypothetical protein|uniref:Uncharacterized protein n=1 Tax=candidate division CPR1 bacterium ADurb.Bin160 TaxID=1852826 RepID=A0A1V5ZPY2_9BACT|nr:MAG: hypothetical protein BWY04_00259 [candidate division CPR1 bacterium ADurb.Bin160]
MTHTGQVNPPRDHLIFDLLNEIKFFHNFHNAEKVSFTCAQISFNPIQIAWGIGYFISFMYKAPDVIKAIPNMQLSSSHSPCTTVFCCSLSYKISILFQIFSFSTNPTFQAFTSVLFIFVIMSPV